MRLVLLALFSILLLLTACSACSDPNYNCNESLAEYCIDHSYSFFCDKEFGGVLDAWRSAANGTENIAGIYRCGEYGEVIEYLNDVFYNNFYYILESGEMVSVKHWSDQTFVCGGNTDGVLWDSYEKWYGKADLACERDCSYDPNELELPVCTN